MEISRSRRVLSVGVLSLVLSRIFIATDSPVKMWVALRTMPNVPSPILSPKVNWAMFLRTDNWGVWREWCI